MENSEETGLERYGDMLEQFEAHDTLGIELLPTQINNQNMSGHLQPNQLFSHMGSPPTSREFNQRDQFSGAHNYTTMMGVPPEQMAFFDNNNSSDNTRYGETGGEHILNHYNTSGIDDENVIDPSLRSAGTPNLSSGEHHSQEMLSHTRVLEDLAFGEAMKNIHPKDLFALPAAGPSHVVAAPSTQAQGDQIQQLQRVGNRPTQPTSSQPTQRQITPATMARPASTPAMIASIQVTPAAARFNYTLDSFTGCRKGLFAKGMGIKEDKNWSMETLVNHIQPFLKFHNIRPDFKVFPKGKGSDLTPYLQKKGAVEALSPSDRKLLDDFIQAHADLKRADSPAPTPPAAAGPPQIVADTTETGKSRASATNKRRRDHEDEEDEIFESVHVVDDGAVPETFRPSKKARPGPAAARTPQTRSNPGPSGSNGNILAAFPDFEAVNKYLANIGQPGIMEIVNNHLVSNGQAAVRLNRNLEAPSSALTSSNLNSAAHRQHTQMIPPASENIGLYENTRASTVPGFDAPSLQHNFEQPLNMNINGQPSSGISALASSQPRKRKAGSDVSHNNLTGKSDMSGSAVKKSRYNPPEFAFSPNEKQKTSTHRSPVVIATNPVAFGVMSRNESTPFSGFEPSGSEQINPTPFELSNAGNGGHQAQDYFGAGIGIGAVGTSLRSAPQPVDLFDFDAFDAIPENFEFFNNPPSFTETPKIPDSMAAGMQTQPSSAVGVGQYDVWVSDDEDFDVDSAPELNVEYFTEYLAKHNLEPYHETSQERTS